MNLPVAISKICSMRPEETLIGIENWVDVAEMEVVSKCVMVNHDGLEIVEIVTSENDYLIYCDIFPGFSTFPVSESSIMGEKLWNLVGRMPHSLDDPVYFAPKKTKLLLKNLKRKIRRIDMKLIDVSSYSTSLDWRVVAPEIAARLIPSAIRNVVQIEVHGIRMLVTPESVGFDELRERP